MGKIIYPLILVGLLNGCSNSREVPQISGLKSGAQAGNDPWRVVRTADSGDGSVHVVQTQMTEAERDRIRTRSKRVNLVQLPIDARYNASVFRITDESIPDYQNRVFVAPRIFSYGSQDGGKLAPIHHDDHTTTISFNVAFVDGVNSTLQNPGAAGKTITLPDSYRIRNPEELKALLQNQYGASNGLAPLPGCPKKITVVAGNHEFDATSNGFLDGDACQLNVPFAVSITVPDTFADYLLYQGLYAGLVDVRAIFETRVSFPVSNLKISFDRQKLQEGLTAELGVKTAFVDAEVKAAVDRVAKRQMAKVIAQGDMGPIESELISRMMSEFFEPFKPDQDHSVSGCSSAMACLRFSYSNTQQSSTLDFTFAQVSDWMEGQNLVTSTKLKATPRTAVIGKGVECEKDCHRLSNHGAPRETGLTVLEGNQIVIEPNYAMVEHRDLLSPQVRRIPNPVCVHTHQDCHTLLPPIGVIGVIVGQIKKECHEVCDTTQDQWHEETLYSSDHSREETLTDPSGMLDQIYGGMTLGFVWKDRASGKLNRVQCPLSAFPRVGESQKIEVKLKNAPNCKPFTGNPEETPMLQVANEIEGASEYLEGPRVVDWRGGVLQNPKPVSFIPEVQLGLTLRMKGYDFEGDARSVQ